MALLLPSLVKSSSGGHGISSKEEGVRPFSPKKELVLTIVIFFHTSVVSCGGDHGISCREEGVWPPGSKRERSTTMAIFLPCLVDSC